MPKDTKQEKRGLKLRVVLDTNVYASAFNFPRGKVASIWEHALKGTYTLLSSPAIVAELANVLREKFKWPENDIKARAKRFARMAQIITPKIVPNVIKEIPPIITSWPVPERDRQISLFPVISICVELKLMRASQLSVPLISSVLLQVIP